MNFQPCLETIVTMIATNISLNSLMRAHMLTLLSPPVPNSGREEAIETMNSQLGFILREENTEELMADYINKIESADQLQILEEELTNGAYDFEAAKETEEEPSPSWAEAMAPLIEQRRTEIVGTQL